MLKQYRKTKRRVNRTRNKAKRTTRKVRSGVKQAETGYNQVTRRTYKLNGRTKTVPGREPVKFIGSGSRKNKKKPVKQAAWRRNNLPQSTTLKWDAQKPKVKAGGRTVTSGGVKVIRPGQRECRDCGRELTDPRSIKLGYGPECRAA